MQSDTTGPAAANELQATTLARRVERATGRAHETIDSVSDAARPAVERMTTSAHGAVDRVASVATQAAVTLGVKGEQVKTARDRLVEDARQRLKEHPLASLGIAIAVGYMLSRLLTPR